MKIGLVRRGHSATGGAERYLVRFVAGLVTQGHIPVLFTDHPWPKEVWHWETILVPAQGDSPRSFADALRASRPESRCDLLYSLERVWECDVFRAGDGVHAAWLRRRASVEPAWKSTFRSWQRKHRDLLDLERALYQPESKVRIVANSPLIRDEIMEEYGTPLARIGVVPNGYDPPRVDPGMIARRRESLGLVSGELAILFVGSGWERKGLQSAIEAVENLDARGGGVRLVVAGEGKRRHLRIRDPKRILFLGAVSELPSLYEASDIFVLPTLYDPFSNATLEAAAHGLPIVTTRGNGVSHYGFAGTILESPGGVEALASALEAWIPEERRAFAELQNRVLAREFSVAANVQRTLDFISSKGR